MYFKIFRELKNYFGFFPLLFLFPINLKHWCYGNDLRGDRSTLLNVKGRHVKILNSILLSLYLKKHLFNI